MEVGKRTPTEKLESTNWDIGDSSMKAIYGIGLIVLLALIAGVIIFILMIPYTYPEINIHSATLTLELDSTTIQSKKGMNITLIIENKLDQRIRYSSTVFDHDVINVWLWGDNMSNGYPILNGNPQLGITPNFDSYIGPHGMEETTLIIPPDRLIHYSGNYRLFASLVIGFRTSVEINLI